MTETESKITVVDDTMGSGKTSFMIEYMNAYPEKSYIYCTPFLSEVRRIMESCPSLDFQEPSYSGGYTRKIDSFNNLLAGGKNIVLTHSTFANATPETIQYIRDSNYILILDEVIDLLKEYNECEPPKALEEGDVDLLLENGLIEVGEDELVRWTAKDYKKFQYLPIMRMANNGALLLLQGKLLVWQFPHSIFELFEHVYVLTYLFEGSVMKYYFDYHNIEYSKKSIEGGEICDENGECYRSYGLIEYRQNTEKQKEYEGLVNIWKNQKANNYKGSSLSRTWNSRSQNRKELEQLRKHLKNYFTNFTKAKAEQIMWTCRKKEKGKKEEGINEFEILSIEQGEDGKKRYVIPIGRTVPRKRARLEERDKQYLIERLYLRRTGDIEGDYSRAEKLFESKGENVTEKERECLEKHSACFVPLNARATNEFRDREILAYCVNMYAHSFIRNFFQRRKVAFNEDMYALGLMLQWIWRSRIRDGEPIKIYIPSTRMRTLFEKWLAGEKYE